MTSDWGVNNRETIRTSDSVGKARLVVDVMAQEDDEEFKDDEEIKINDSFDGTLNSRDSFTEISLSSLPS